MALALRAQPIRPEPPSPRKRSGKRLRTIQFKFAKRGLSAGTVVSVVLAAVMAYVWLTAELTAQTYRLHDAQAAQAALQLQTQELRQRVARLESLPRLEAAAAQLHMTVPTSVALITPPSVAATQPRFTAVAASINVVRRWLDVR